MQCYFCPTIDKLHALRPIVRNAWKGNTSILRRYLYCMLCFERENFICCVWNPPPSVCVCVSVGVCKCVQVCTYDMSTILRWDHFFLWPHESAWLRWFITFVKIRADGLLMVTPSFFFFRSLWITSFAASNEILPETFQRFVLFFVNDSYASIYDDHCFVSLQVFLS